LSSALTPVPSTINPSPRFPPPSAAELEKLFGNSSCSWPCWQGITPGITTGSEALKRLNDSPLILKKYSIQSEGSITGPGRADWHWKIDDKLPEENGNMRWKNGIIWLMELTVSSNFSVGEVITRFGPPEKISVINCQKLWRVPHGGAEPYIM
jgi:hypothetical protein